jgi:hypothetical protein
VIFQNRLRKARSKKRKDDHGADVDILKEKHTHRKGHVEQHHIGDDNEILLRTNETWESTDITDFEKSQSRHLDLESPSKERGPSNFAGLLMADGGGKSLLFESTPFSS